MIVSLPAQGAQYDATPADVQAYDVAHRQAPVGVPQHPARGRVRLRHLAPEGTTRSAAAGTTGASSRSTSRAASPSSRSAARASTSTAAIGRGNNLFGNSLVALDATTGKRIWHFQTRASRSVGLRPAAGAEAPDHPPERPQHRRRRAGDRSTDSCSCSSARPAVRSGRSRSVRSPSRTSRVSGRRRRSRSRPSRRRSRDSRSRRRTSIRTCRRRSAQAIVERFKYAAQRGAVHAAQLRGLDSAARSQRRRELRQLRRRSDARRDVRRRRRACRR